jgi:hypothetical protein
MEQWCTRRSTEDPSHRLGIGVTPLGSVKHRQRKCCTRLPHDAN